MEVSALIVGAVAGIATGLIVKNRSRKVRIGLLAIEVYIGIVLVVMTIAYVRMNSN